MTVESLAWLLQDFWNRRTAYTPAEAKEIWRDLRWNVLDDGEYQYEPATLAALDNFNTAGFEYDDLRDEKWDDYTSHYLWSLQAIVWGIQQYRAAKTATIEGAS